MDTDIDNYTTNEILKLLRIDKKTCNEPLLRKKTIDALNKVNESNINNSSSLLDFFRKCYMRVAVAKGFHINENIRKELNLPPLPNVDTDNITIPHPNTNDYIVERRPYNGSVYALDSTKIAVNTIPSEYARGINDPIRRETIKHTLVLSSKFRINLNNTELTKTQSDRINLRTYCTTTNYKIKNIRDTIFPDASNCPTITNNASRGLTTDFTVELDEPYNNVVALRASGLEFVNSRYNVTNTLETNEFRVGGYTYTTATGTPTGPPQWETIKIPDGFYDVATLISTINTELAATTNVANQQIQIDITNPLQKIVFRINPAAIAPPPGESWAFELDFRIQSNPTRNIYLNLGWMLGFRKSEYNFSRDYNVVDILTASIGFNAEALANTSGTPFYLLEVNDYNNNNPTVVDYNCNSQFSFNIRNLLAKVPNTSTYDTVIFEDSSDRIWKTRRYFGPVRIKKLTIRLLDDVGRVVDTNDGDFTLTLEVTTLNMPYKNMTH